MDRQRGFTLIELVMVFAIIGILAAVSVPNLKRLRSNMVSRDAALTMRTLMRKGQSRAVATQRIHMLAVRLRGSTTLPDQAALFDYVAASTFQSSTLPLNALKGTQAPPAPLKLVDRIDMPATVGFGPPGGAASLINIPYPFNGIQRAKQCAFCGSSDGAIFFMPSGEVQFSDGSAIVDQLGSSVTIAPQDQWATPDKGDTIYTITILRSTGATRVWQPR